MKKALKQFKGFLDLNFFKKRIDEERKFIYYNPYRINWI